MNTRNTVLGVAVAALAAGGIYWYIQSSPAPVAEKPAAVAPAKPAEPKVAVPVTPSKMAVAAPVVAPVVPSANPQPVRATSTPGVDPTLTAAVNDLVASLESQDMTGFVQTYMVPSMMEMVNSQMEARMADPNTTPEMKAQMQQIMQQQAPQMIERITQQMAQRPEALQGMQKLGAALKQAPPPQMNDAGDHATYTLASNGDKDVPSSLVMVQRDGKWTLDFASMARAAQGQ